MRQRWNSEVQCYVEWLVEDAAAAAAADDDAQSDRLYDIDYNDLPHHLILGSQLTFSITVLQASGIPADCTDVFCQF